MKTPKKTVGEYFGPDIRLLKPGRTKLAKSAVTEMRTLAKRRKLGRVRELSGWLAVTILAAENHLSQGHNLTRGSYRDCMGSLLKGC